MRLSEKLSSLGLGDVYMVEGRTDVALEDLVRHLSASCDEFMARNNRVTPMYHIVCRIGFHLIIDNVQGDKDEAVAKVRFLLKAADAIAYAFCDEAWFAKYESDEVKEGSVPNVPPDQRQDREEVVLIQAESEREGEITATRKIIRSKDGKPTLGPLDIKRFEQSVGRMVGMLPRRGTLQ